ncbi:MAG: hypothetical protein WAZ98_11105 [Cyclobacteriaceae bacterium]
MRWVIFIFLAAITTSASAYISGIAIQTEKNSSMQVYVNGKLRTSQAKSFVRIKGNPGLYRIAIKVLNPHDKEWYVVRKDILVEKGYEFYYRVNFQKGKRPVIELVRRYPVYSNYFLNPTLYNKHPIS